MIVGAPFAPGSVSLRLYPHNDLPSASAIVDELRTQAVLAVLYLLFNEGYAASEGSELLRTDLAAEAIRLARTLVELMPDEPEAGALLALMLFHDARRAGRVLRTSCSC